MVVSIMQMHKEGPGREEEGLLTITEAAKVLNVNKDTIRRRIKKGEIKAEKMPGPYGLSWYIKEKDIAEAAQVVDVVPVNRPLEAQELKEIMHQVVEPLHKEIAMLRSEVAELQQQLEDKKTIEGKQPSWWQRLFRKGRV